MQRQTEQQQQQEMNMRQYQQTQAQAQYPQTHFQQQTVQRRPSSTSIVSNDSSYYKVKPQLWDAFGGDKFAMSPPSYVQNTTSNIVGSNPPTTYGLESMESMSSVDPYPRPRGAGYSSFANGGGANANFRMSTQNQFSVPKR